MTTHSWDEEPTGEWTLEIENVAGASDYGESSAVPPSREPLADPPGTLGMSVFPGTRSGDCD